MKDLFGNEVPEPTLYDFSVMNVELTKQFLSDTHDKHNSKGHDMLMRTRITRRVLSILALHPDWDEDEVFQKVQDSFRKGGGTVIARKIDRELYAYFLQNWRDIIKLEDIEPGHEYDHYAKWSNVRLTKEQYVEKAVAIWGDAYDYTDSVYIAQQSPITIFCKKHQKPFTLKAAQMHINHGNRPCGCPDCSAEKRQANIIARRIERERLNPPKPKKPIETPKEMFLRRAKAMYPDYDFSQVEYKNRQDIVTIICPTHGPFEISPRTLLNGEKGKKPHGCWRCNGLIPPNERKFTLEMFKAKMRELYGPRRYKFMWEDYKNKDSQIRFHCRRHGWQKRSVTVLLEGKGCEYCNGRFYPPDWIKNARKVHGDKYEYDESQPPKVVADYIRYKCPIHGWKESRYDCHVLQGCECIECANPLSMAPADERKAHWVERCRKKFNDRFDYSQFEYVDNDTKGIIICREHQCSYEQDPWTHLRGSGGCPVCSGSEGEVHIRTWLENHNVNFIPQYQIPNENPKCKRQYLVPDFWVPDYNLFIEMNGQQHYKYIAHFHDNDQWTFEDQQIRDETLRTYCKEHKHNLLEIKYYEIKQIPKILERTLKKYAPK